VPQRFAAKEMIRWAIQPPGHGEAIGTVGLVRVNHEHRRGKLGYDLARRWWGQGLAPEAAAAVVTWGFAVMGLHRIEAGVLPGNNASVRVLEKLGFREEGTCATTSAWGRLPQLSVLQPACHRRGATGGGRGRSRSLIAQAISHADQHLEGQQSARRATSADPVSDGALGPGDADGVVEPPGLPDRRRHPSHHRPGQHDRIKARPRQLAGIRLLDLQPLVLPPLRRPLAPVDAELDRLPDEPVAAGSQEGVSSSAASLTSRSSPVVPSMTGRPRSGSGSATVTVLP
jgi:hypothetical protein